MTAKSIALAEASAVFQENVGRQGNENFPFCSIENISIADYFSFGNGSHATQYRGRAVEAHASSAALVGHGALGKRAAH